jgi:alanine dehydrogenase
MPWKSPTRAGKRPCRRSAEIKAGANVIDGKVTYKAVAEAFDMEQSWLPNR